MQNQKLNLVGKKTLMLDSLRVGICCLIVSVAIISEAEAAVLFEDDWADRIVATPLNARYGVDWQVESGSISADSTLPPSGFLNPADEVLMFAPNSASEIYVNFGPSVKNAPIEVRFKLRQTNGSAGSYRFKFGFKDTSTGYSYAQSASPNVGFYGVSGFHSMIPTGGNASEWTYGAGVAGTALSSLSNEWNYIKLRFDPNLGIQVWQAIDPVGSKAYSDGTLVYRLVATWDNFRDLLSFDQFFMDNDNHTISWMVDDVEIDSPKMILEDDFTDRSLSRPTGTSSDLDWTIETGSFSANPAAPPSGFLGTASQALMFGPSVRSRISLNFGMSAPHSIVEARIKLKQNNNNKGNYRFQFGLGNSINRYQYMEYASANVDFYGVSGFHTMAHYTQGPSGWQFGPGLEGGALSSSLWNYIKFSFNPLTGVEVWCAVDAVSTKVYTDATLSYTKVASWANFSNVRRVDQLFLDNDASGLSWMVDDVEIDSNGARVFSDDFADNLVEMPQSCVDWVVEEGAFSADSASPPAGFLSPQEQTLMFGPSSRAFLSATFGATVTHTPIEARFKLRQTSGSSENSRFGFGFANTVTGHAYLQYAAPNTAYYGGSGFHSMAYSGPNGDDLNFTMGAAGSFLSPSSTSWNYIKFIFDPEMGVQVWQAIDSSKSKTYDDATLVYTLVASWENFWSLEGVDKFFFDNDGGAISWMVDDIEIEGSRWFRTRSAVQTVYQTGTPHTSANGLLRTSYSATQSFLPIGIYHFWAGAGYGQTWSFQDLASAGFNFAQLYSGQDYLTAANLANAAQPPVKIIPLYSDASNSPTPAQVRELKAHDALLGWQLYDEPSGAADDPNVDMPKRVEDFISRRDLIHSIEDEAPASIRHPVHTIDANYITGTGLPWFSEFAAASDVAGHDNYPINGRNDEIVNPLGIPGSVSLSVNVNNEGKPVWFCAQAHFYDSSIFPAEFPTPAQERCMIFTALIHGATGILYFGMDSFVMRDGNVVGIAPASKLSADYGYGITATAAQLNASATLWESIVSLNSDLAILKPSILSPTATQPYEVYVDGRTPGTPSPIRTLLKLNPSGGYTLLLSNLDRSAQIVRIRFPGNSTFTVSELIDGPGILSRTSDEFVIYCPGYDARAFSLADSSSSVPDGSPYLLKYALGISPNQNSSSAQPILGTNDGYATLSFYRQRAAMNIVYEVEVSSDLISWTEIWSSYNVPYGGGMGQAEWITVQDPVRDASRRFLRLKITQL